MTMTPKTEAGGESEPQPAPLHIDINRLFRM